MSDAAGGRDKSFGPWPVIALLVLAAALRSFKLGQGFWYDEIYSVTHFFRAGWLQIVTSMPDPNNHPLYSLMAKLSITLLGEKEWTARLPAVILGSATPPLLYLAGKRFLRTGAGAVAAVALSFSMWHVYYSQDARGYSTAIFLSLLAWMIFLLMIEKPTVSRAAGYALLAAGASYAHLYAVSVPAGHLAVAVGLVVFNPKEKRRDSLIIAGSAFAALALTGLAYLPMARDLIRFAGTEGQLVQTREMGLGFIGGLFLSWASGSDGLAPSLPALIAFAVGAVMLLKGKRILFLSWLMPLAAGLSIPLVTGTFVYHRFFSFAMPGFYLIAGHGVIETLDRLRAPGWTRAAATAVLAAMFVLPLLSYYRLGKEGLKPAAEWIDTNARGYKIISIGLAREEFLYYCPEAVALSPSQSLSPELISHAVVVFAHPWSVSDAAKYFLENSCGAPIRFRAAAYEENMVVVYKCDPEVHR